MKMNANIKVFMTISAIAGLTALSQYTAGRITVPSDSDQNISAHSRSVLEQEDSLLSTTIESVNESRFTAFSNIVSDKAAEVMNDKINEYSLLQDLHLRGYAEFHIKTLETINNGNDASHLAIWSVARELENGERELVVGKINTLLRKQAEGEWTIAESTWTQSAY